MHTRINGNEITFQNVIELQSIISHLKGIEKDLKSQPSFAEDKHETKLLKLLKGVATDEKDKTKGILRKAHKKDNNLIVTDGYKLAFIEDTKHPNRVYHILKEGALQLDDTPERAFPNCEKIYPKTYENILTADLTGLDRAIKANKKNFASYGKMLFAVVKISSVYSDETGYFKSKTLSLVHPETKEVFFSTEFYSLYSVEDINIQFDMKNLLPVLELIEHVSGLKCVTIKYAANNRGVCFESEGIKTMVMPYVS